MQLKAQDLFREPRAKACQHSLSKIDMQIGPLTASQLDEDVWNKHGRILKEVDTNSKKSCFAQVDRLTLTTTNLKHKAPGFESQSPAQEARCWKRGRVDSGALYSFFQLSAKYSPINPFASFEPIAESRLIVRTTVPGCRLTLSLSLFALLWGVEGRLSFSLSLTHSHTDSVTCQPRRGT